MLGQVIVIDQLESFEIRNFKRCRLSANFWTFLILAAFGRSRQLAPERFDEMGPLLLNIGTQIEIARLQQSIVC